MAHKFDSRSVALSEPLGNIRDKSDRCDLRARGEFRRIFRRRYRSGRVPLLLPMVPRWRSWFLHA